MKTSSYLALLLIIFTLGCSSESNHQNSVDKKSIENSISDKLDQWHNDAAETNFEAYFSTFSDSGIYIGTDASEIWSLEEFKSFSKPYFDNGKAWSFKAIDRNLYTSNNSEVIWFDELLDTWMGKCRGSGVFQIDNGTWKLEHYVLSLTVPNAKMDSVISVIKEQ